MFANYCVVLLGSYQVLPNITRFYWAITEFSRILLVFIEFYLVLAM